MAEHMDHIRLTDAEFAHLGEGEVAYFRQVKSDDLTGRFPGIPEIQPGLDLWALFAANGRPILLADDKDRVVAGAMMNELTPVSIH